MFSDDDVGDNAFVVYTIKADPTNKFIGSFYVGPATGVIKLSDGCKGFGESEEQCVDYEEAETITITVVGTAGTGDKKSTEATVTFDVQDKNDNRPTFQGLYNRKINENVAIGHAVMTLSAIDPDPYCDEEQEAAAEVMPASSRE